MGLSPLKDANGNFLKDADGNQLYVYTLSPPSAKRTVKVEPERRVVKVPAE